MTLPFLQDIIHRLEVGGGMRFFRASLTLLVLLTAVVGYNWRAFRNLSSQEAMDAAQLGRNIAEGKGYTTLFIRPLSIYLVTRTSQQTPGKGLGADPALLKYAHPDLANPPVYPVLLAGLMKVLPFRFELPTKPVPFWTHKGAFYRYQPDFLIGLFNQALFLVMIVLLFFLARRLFDPAVAWLSATLILLTELFWHFTISGLSTILLMLLFTILAWCLVLLEHEGRAPEMRHGRLFLLAAASGLLVGLSGLTRYSCGWLILPVMTFVILFSGPRKVLASMTTLLVFAAVLGPWIARNLHLSNMPFGTASYTLFESTILSPGTTLQRSLEPNLSNFSLTPFWYKLLNSLRHMSQSELPRLGGSWLSVFFIVGLLIGFRNPALRRLRYFILFCLPVLALAQALGHTHLSDDVPEINSENLLVILSPLIIVYGAGIFFTLLDQISFPFPELRYFAILLLGAIASLPMLLVFLPPKSSPTAYPPYNPPVIQYIADWVKPSELTMSDVPWAIAWYGQRQSAWMTLKATGDASDPTSHEDFLAINDFHKRVAVLYLTPRTMDAPFFTEWLSADERGWGNFLLDTMLKKEPPSDFPLHQLVRAWLPAGQLVLTDTDRWNARRQ